MLLPLVPYPLGRTVGSTHTDGGYVHRGIAARDFERRFSLADFVEVKDASFEDGLLQMIRARAARGHEAEAD